jgi:hypothetical protein
LEGSDDLAHGLHRWNCSMCASHSSRVW